VDDLAQRSLVLTRAARALQHRGMSETPRAAPACRPPSRQRVAAPVATVHRHWPHRAPAAVAHRSSERLIQERSTHGALGRQHDPNDSVHRGGEHALVRAKVRPFSSLGRSASALHFLQRGPPVIVAKSAR
jgi:hypothetical protein